MQKKSIWPPSPGPKGMARFVPEEGAVTPRRHHEWATMMWNRMDRDHSHAISREELDCEEFRSVLHSILVPKSGAHTGGSTYARAEMNMNQAINFCLRKADLNDDNKLSYREWEAFLLMLRQTHLAKHTANLIFSLFDLDQDGNIDVGEFREIFRFYLGHKPTEEEFQQEWGRLDSAGRQYVTREDYIRWLQTSTNPIFQQHAPPEEQDLGHSHSGPLPALQGSSSFIRPRWNQRFNASANPNSHCPPQQRAYFSRPQSLPELTRHYESHRGFRKHHSSLQRPEPRKRSPVLSTSTGVELLQERALPAGYMRDPTTGMRNQWRDNWQTPECMKPRIQSGTLDLRCMGTPPRFLYADDDEL